MISIAGSNWQSIIPKVADKLLVYGNTIHTKNWHAMDISNESKYTMHELIHASIQGPLHSCKEELSELSPNLPWAEDHFQERISGIPYNPAPSHVNWPFAQKENTQHIDGGKFSHTYPERFWPKFANMEHIPGSPYARAGIRFYYGDLDSVISLLLKDNTTRQAFLPIWFPEDTGSVSGQRVPCTLGYHFIIRNGFLDVTYYMRSCDFIRNFRDDVYMACRLGQHIVEKINTYQEFGEEIIPRALVMHITSLHLFKSEISLLENLCR